jgi:2-polyprenyl-3-methyl-5-hydroxy-6-metoxy-1,4-benzoquinol methylase
MLDLEKFKNSLLTIKTQLDKFKDGLEVISNALTDLHSSIDGYTMPAMNESDNNLMTAQSNLEDTSDNDFENLKKALLSDKWPECVNSTIICDPKCEDDLIARGKGIVELMMFEGFKPGTKFLDYGCGDGYAVTATTNMTALSVGYDIKPQGWSKFADAPNLLLTSNFEEVKAKGPYDVILLYDVLDHLQLESPTAVLKKAASVLTDDGSIYMRVHPFTSRHATHHYTSINKAYIHLVFTPEELKQLIPVDEYASENIGVTYPVKTYPEFIAQAGLKIITDRRTTDTVEPFFRIPKIAERIMKNTKMPQFPEFQMSIQFLDYVLKKA